METISSRRPRVVLSGRARRIVVAVGAILALVAVGAWSAGEIAARSAARAARRAVADRRFAEAEAALGRWLRARPRSAEAHYLKARVALALGRPQEAVDELAAARVLGHPAAPLDRLDAIIRANAGRHAEAEPVLRRVLEGSKAPDPEAAEALARVYLETYRFQDAAAGDRPLDPRGAGRRQALPLADRGEHATQHGRRRPDPRLPRGPGARSDPRQGPPRPGR